MAKEKIKIKEKEEGKKQKKAKEEAVSKKLERELEEAEEEVEKLEENGENEAESSISTKASKPIAQIKKGDKIKVDGVEYEVDAHYVLMDHGTTKEMAIEIFSGDKDGQIRYFNDQAERTIEFYELQGEIMFVKKPVKRIEW